MHSVSGWVAVRTFLAAVCLGLPLAASAQHLLIGRVDFASPLSDTAERVVLEALRRSGLTAELKRFPLTRSIELANDGELDADLMRIADAGAKFSNLVAVPTPVTTINVALYGRDASVANKPGEQIAKLKIGLTRGTLALVKHSAGMSVTDTQTISTTFDMLQAGRFDIAMMVHLDAELEIMKNNIQGIARRDSYWATEPLYFYVNKKNSALIPKINMALLAMQKEGLIKKYYDETLQKLNISPLIPTGAR